ncbi:MAG: hypothetical protein LBV51_05990 [Acholeplasmatales bacterium]|jgi:hypothetical protein|nr:hypothetical protein [Acholeplasmatales bacterium]
MKKDVLEDSVEFYRYGSFIKNTIIVWLSTFGLVIVIFTVFFIKDNGKHPDLVFIYIFFSFTIIPVFLIPFLILPKPRFSKIIIGNDGIKIVSRKITLQKILWDDIKFVKSHMILNARGVKLKVWSLSTIDTTYLKKRN